MKKILKSKNPLIKITFGAVCGIVAAIIMMLIFSLVIVKYDLSFDIFKYFWFVITALSSLISSFFCALNLTKQRLIWSMLSSLAVSLIIFILLLISAKFSANVLIYFIPVTGLIFGFFGTLIAASKN